MTNAAAIVPSRQPAAERLRTALAEMVRQHAAAGDQPMTATALCQLAGVSRNALYRFHSDVLHDLHKAQRQRRREPGPDERTLLRLRDENEFLNQQVAKLAALVDHYFAAWQESRALLDRRERELSEVRRTMKPKLVPITS